MKGVRWWLSALLFGLLSSPGLALGGGPKRVLLVQSMPVLPVLNHTTAFISHLGRLGHVPGRGLELVVLEPEGDRDRAAAMLNEAMTAGPVDLVVTSATLASQVAHERLAGEGIPQLFFTVSDPVGAGLVAELGRSDGGNITGKVHSVPRRTKIELALRLLGIAAGERPVRFGLIHADYPSSQGDVRLLAEAAADFPGVEFIPYVVAYRPIPVGLPAMLAGVEAGITALEGRVDYWWEPSGPLGETPEYTRLLRDRSRRPVVYGTNMESVRLGALLHVTPQDEATGREAAQLAAAILDGASPGGFPVTAPREVELGINLASAVGLGLAVPSELVLLAGPNLFREQAP